MGHVISAISLIVIFTLGFIYVEVMKAKRRPDKDQDYLTRVHIAGEPTSIGQTCSRCGIIMVENSSGLMTLDLGTGPVGPLYWKTGEFVGVLEKKSGEKTNPICSFRMEHDAEVDEESEEIACGVIVKSELAKKMEDQWRADLRNAR